MKDVTRERFRYAACSHLALSVDVASAMARSVYMSLCEPERLARVLLSYHEYILAWQIDVCRPLYSTEHGLTSEE